jgi:hypothetical protein
VAGDLLEADQHCAMVPAREPATYPQLVREPRGQPDLIGAQAQQHCADVPSAVDNDFLTPTPPDSLRQQKGVPSLWTGYDLDTRILPVQERLSHLRAQHHPAQASSSEKWLS